MPNPTKKDLQDLIKHLQEEITHLTGSHAHDAEELQVTKEALAEARAALTAAQEVTATAEAARADLQLQLDQAIVAAGHAPPGERANIQIPRPLGSGWSIQESMQITKEEYAEIQRTIRSLVIRAMLDWTDDFRHQDADKMATLFRAARTAHPILDRYANNWATAAIACQYMQNKRKHAYKQGYISKRRAHQAGDDDSGNAPGPSRGIGRAS